VPELPEVETMRRGIAPIVGARIVAVRRTACRKKPIRLWPRFAGWRRRLPGRAITGTSRVGKRVVVELDGGDRLVFEPRMTGLVLLADPPNQEHLRLEIALSGAPARRLLYWDRRGLGSVRLLTREQFRRLYSAPRVGTDALEIGHRELRAKLCRSRRAIKSALLDQGAVAGIGNLYASEILHVCRIHPARPCNSLSAPQWRALHAAMLSVLEQAIRYEGSTLSDGTYRNALNQDGSYQHLHRVYDKQGQLCAACGRAAIQRLVIAGRSSYFCPVCQRPPRVARKPRRAKTFASAARRGSNARVANAW
jgi:formamidopyrimidine-DNA glycosylase